MIKFIYNLIFKYLVYIRSQEKCTSHVYYIQFMYIVIYIILNVHTIFNINEHCSQDYYYNVQHLTIKIHCTSK